ncbi:AP-4 complex accessory subunit tepsin-like [Diadema antillarum]|uniref:AP-4 complex accessory subunit tepsin-like n=1 Tax=Diadema antillarum TaxID=105358 RepID=UPI003A8A7AD7
MAAPTGFLTEVVEKVSFVNKWPMLLKATQDDETPTPGYLYNDITALTYESGSNCQCLVDFLADRLDKNSCHVKFKVLKVMLHIVDHGHEAFSDRLRNKAKGIQLSTKYSGPPHPLHGMAPYVAVRKTAKELSEKLFDTEASSRRSSSQRTGRSGHMTQATRKMDGIGNSPISAQKPVTIESLGESVKEGLQHIANRLSGENKISLASSQSGSGYRALHGNDAGSSHYDSHGFTTQGFINSRSPAFPRHISDSSNYTPVTIGNDDDGDGDGDDAPRSTGSHVMRTLSSTKAAVPDRDEKTTDLLLDSRGGKRSNSSKGSDQLSGASSDLSERLESVAVADWSQEVSLVETFISNSETRQTPPKGELQQFVKGSSSLNCQKILDLLTASIKSSPGNQLRCLFGIEGIVKEDLVSSDVALALLSSHLSALTTSPDRAIRSKALKILRQLERLEADTRLDQPVMSDAQLIPQPDLDLSRVQIPTDSQELQSTTDIPSTSNSVGSLFSGMSLAEKTPSAKSHQGVPSEAGLLLGGLPPQSPSSHVDVSLLDSKVEGKESMLCEDLLLTDGIKDPQTKEDGQIQQAVFIPPGQDINQVNFTPPTQQLNKGDVTSSGARVDPLMSREAGFAELWSSISPNDSPTKKPLKKPPLPTSSGVPSVHGSPLRSSAQPGLTSQQIASLYPQLSNSVLSGASSTPLNLATKPTTGFGFVASGDGEDKQTRTSSTRDVFSFVQDALKSGKK